MNRRKFLRRSLLGLAAGTGYATLWEPFWTEYVAVDLTINRLPPTLEGKTLLQISDLHVGKHVSSDFLAAEFRRARGLNPDFVVYTGDLVDEANNAEITEWSRLLECAPRGSLGTFAILGNHDYGRRFRDPGAADRVAAATTAGGIPVLRNATRTVAGLSITGLDDYWGNNFDPEPVLSHLDPEAANLVLCHNPDVCDLEVWADYRGWILAGHTHGGQCRMPGFGPPILPVRNKSYAAGLIQLGDGRTLYVNRALGHSLRVRFAVRPEITVFTLRGA